ncbi:hypothetical protein HNR02_002099 [Amycolatopsis endophytica]|uniref:Uncharacterized protein n=1 Tax=Amycolatopsis endophytica TaxID=860233 RepID=A0A853B287_9PSEU|nr:hypothetical protein [Amycolatopsis endophytica]NYI88776.1 hypothetical protein [Amycolatopsis endophytica]
MDQPVPLFNTTRTFRVWHYDVGRSELTLRTHDDPDEPVELLFEGVLSMRFDRLWFPGLAVDRAEDTVLQSPTVDIPHLCIELRSPEHSGEIVCRSLTSIGGTHPDGKVLWTITASRPRSRLAAEIPAVGPA